MLDAEGVVTAVPLESERSRHWDSVYATKREDEVSWFQDVPAVSLDLIERCAPPRDGRILDVGGGTSRLVDALLDRGFGNVSVLDVSAHGLAAARARLGDRAARVQWLVQDVTAFEPAVPYDVWHDRAVFHFLTTDEERAAYVRAATAGVARGGHLILGTFGLDGPERCSGLPVLRYDAASLAAVMGPAFEALDSLRHKHVTPSGKVQPFQFVRFCRV